MDSSKLAGLVMMAVVGASPLAAQEPGALARLGWLGGCWELRSGARVTSEQWMAPAGTLMLGMSRTVVRDTVKEWEQLRIEARDGNPVYIARPSGQAETAFAATAVTDTGVTFSNPGHDFPQRVLYRRVGADSLVARIEGERGGKVRGVDFPMRRVDCR